jgi:hypothetical protein
MTPRTKRSFPAAPLLAGAVALMVPLPAWAGSCCGGGSATSLMVPSYAWSVADLSFDTELYDGFWNQDGKHISDPPKSDLKQYRLNMGYAVRFFNKWQASVNIPYVWNDNNYSGVSSHSDGLGDITTSLWYEALSDTTAWKVRELGDMIPSVNLGLSLLIPSGISPYDKEESSFDVTGRGFYRLDGNLLIEKTIQPWSASVALSYGTYFERSVNREYGTYVEPYKKQLGDRFSASLAIHYNFYLGSGGDMITPGVTYAYLQEANGDIDGKTDTSSGFRKQSVGVSLAYANNDRDWSVRVGWNHAIQADGWGENFPTTDIISLGVRYVFR